MSKSTPEKSGFFGRLRGRLGGGKGMRLSLSFTGRKLDAELEEELETQLLLADVGIEAAERIIAAMKKRVGRKEIVDEETAREALRKSLAEILAPHARPLVVPPECRPFLLLVVGVNGSGKTTTIGKLARLLQDQGLSVMLAAGDTFRAAATEQLQAWGARNDIPVVAQEPGADPAAVVFDAFESARARGIDVVLADTAGRLQIDDEMMSELVRLKDAVNPHEILLVADGMTGQDDTDDGRIEAVCGHTERG